MAQKTQMRTSQITGSLGDGAGAISTDGLVKTASGSIAAAGLDSVLGHVMAGITRIHGGTDFSNSAAGEFGHAITPAAADGAALGSAAKEWSDIFLADGAVLNFGNGQDTTITHVAANDALQINAAKKLEFGDNGTFIHQSSDGVLTIESDTTVDINGAVVFNGALSGISTIGASGVVTAGGLTVGSAVLIEAELEMIDGITAGTAAASKALVLDASKDIGTIRNLTIDGTFSDGNYTFDTDGNVSGLGTVSAGVVTATGFTIGSAVINEAELETIDGVTAGTAAASKAVVLDGSKNIATLGTVGCGAVTSTGASQMASLTVTGDLTVQGTTVTLDAANLNVEDPFIFMGDGANALNSNAGVVFASGSNNADRPDVVFGRIANNTWALGTVAGTSGSLTDATTMNPEMALRAAKFELSGSTDYVEFDGTDVRIISAADVIVDPGGGELVLDGNLVSATDSTDSLGASGTAWANLYVDDIDLNGQGSISLGGTGRIDLNASDNVSIRASSDTVMTFEAAGADKIDIVSTGIEPSADDGAALGSANKNWSDLYLADAAVLNFGDDQEITLTHVHNNGLLLNAAKQLQFGDDATYVHQVADGVLKIVSDNMVDLSVGAGGVQITGTTPLLTIGDAGAEDTKIVFDGNAQDFYVGLDDSEDDLVLGVGSALGTTVSLALDESRNVDIPAHNGTVGLKLGGTVVGSTAAELNLLDGGTSVGSSITIADGDGFIVNDGGTTKLIPATDLTAYLASSNTRVKTVQDVTSSIAADANYIAGGINTLDAQANPAIMDVYVNGQLMQSGSAAASGDYKILGSAPANNCLVFFFGLEVDDVVTIVEDSR